MDELTKPPKKKTNGKRNKAVGNKYEQEKAREYREVLGLPHTITSRYGSQALDDMKVDLMNEDERVNGFLPLTPQCKCTAGSVAYAKLLDELPKNHGIRVIHHRRTEGKEINLVKGKPEEGTRTIFETTGEYTIMYHADWLQMAKKALLFDKLIKMGVIPPLDGND